MEKPVDRMQCINETCQASNPLNGLVCCQCGLPLVKRYLWAVGNSEKTFEGGELIGDRYISKQTNIFLDTKPGIPPQVTETLPRSIQPYLKLFLLPLNIPQVFGKLLEEEDIWLLEYGTIPLDANGEPQYTQLLPSIRELWRETATPLQQLSWLWQLVRLWEPLKSQGVVSTLFNEDLLKINGSFLQLQQLQTDELKIHKLKDFALLWRTWLSETSPSIRGFLEEICQKLEAEEIQESEDLLLLLDQALKDCQNFYDWSYSLYSQTDTGPSREHNEDACYPENRTLIRSESQGEIIGIVCDGIGGQDAGEVASELAVNSLVEQTTAYLSKANKEDPKISQILRKAIYKTNDLICQRNDREERFQRQRMGTTLVMGIAQKHEVYLANVGDSRVYWITATSCHQVTVDDDIASREVRLGHHLYRNAVQHPTAGALTQALGTSPSNNLYPSIQRQIPDQDCLILLTSDGLSDYDLIDQYWESTLLPLLEGKKELVRVGESLIHLANSKNGHDNTTIILVHCQVKEKTNTQDWVISLPKADSSMVTSPEVTVNSEDNPTQSLPSNKKTSNNKILFGILSLLILGFLAYFGYNSLNSKTSTPTPTPTIPSDN